MAYSTDVDAAREVATARHEGQTDKAGQPYIRHPERVAARLRSPEEQVVGWLHDTVEDTGYTLAQAEAQFGPETAAALDAVSRRPLEEWNQYLIRVKEHPVAKLVKISDLIDNSNLSRLNAVTLKDVERQAKYNRALRFLMTENAAEVIVEKERQHGKEPPPPR